MAVQKKPAKPTQATSAAAWKQGIEAHPLIKTPTGKWIRIKRPGMTTFLQSGFLPDALAATVKQQISEAKRKPTRDMEAGLRNVLDSLSADAALEMLESMDRIMCAVFVEPKCVWHRRQRRDEHGTPMVDEDNNPIMEDIPDDERDDNVIYTDWIEQEDKSFVFQAAVGGTTDLARFRKQQSLALAAVEAKSGVEDAP